MSCSIACCVREAQVEVWFRHSSEPHAYCSWHAYDRRGNPRWRAQDIHKIVGTAHPTPKSGRGWG